MKRKISIGEYNTLYDHAEVGLNKALDDLVLLDDMAILTRLAEGCSRVNEIDKPDCMPNIYYIYKNMANYIVDNILEDLDIEVSE